MERHGAVASVSQRFHLWGLDDPALIPDLVLLSHDTETNRDLDTLVEDFVHGRKLSTLFERCCESIAPWPTTCVIDELTFGQMKALSNSNETLAMTDMLLRYFQNILSEFREERKTSQSHLHLSSLGQIRKMAHQLVTELMPRYTPERMEAVPARRQLSGQLKQSNSRAGQSGLEIKQKKRAGRSKKQKERTDSEWDQLSISAAQKKTRVQIDDDAISAVTSAQRRLAVIAETKVVGQTGRREKFWGSLSAAELEREASAVVPMLWKKACTAFAKGKSEKEVCIIRVKSMAERTTRLRSLIATFLGCPDCNGANGGALWYSGKVLCYLSAKELAKAAPALWLVALVPDRASCLEAAVLERTPAYLR